METFLRGLSAGFIVGVACVAYVLLRLSYIQKQLEANGATLAQSHRINRAWMMMAILSSGSIVWGFLGAAIWYVVRDHVYFVLFSLSIGFIITAMLFMKDTQFKTDKIVLTLAIAVGLGFLIPYLID